MSLASKLWQEAELQSMPPTLTIPGVPPSVRRKAIDALRLHLRATEENEICQWNLQTVLQGLQKQKMQCLSITRDHTTASDRLSCGARVVVNRKLLQINSSIDHLQTLLEKSTAAEVSEQLEGCSMDSVPEEVVSFCRDLEEGDVEEEMME